MHCLEIIVTVLTMIFLEIMFVIKLRKRKIQSSTTPDPEYQWEIDNFTIRYHKPEPRYQSFPSR